MPLFVAGEAFCPLASLEMPDSRRERAPSGTSATVAECHVSARRASQCPKILPHMRFRSSEQLGQWLPAEAACRWACQACCAKCCRARDRRRRMNRQKSPNAASSLTLRGCLFTPDVGVQRRAPAAMQGPARPISRPWTRASGALPRSPVAFGHSERGSGARYTPAVARGECESRRQQRRRASASAKAQRGGRGRAHN
eukprot:scaffold20310_cov125-Isochrysis_galbana.AAC.10